MYCEMLFYKVRSLVIKLSRTVHQNVEKDVISVSSDSVFSFLKGTCRIL